MTSYHQPPNAISDEPLFIYSGLGNTADMLTISAGLRSISFQNVGTANITVEGLTYPPGAGGNFAVDTPTGGLPQLTVNPINGFKYNAVSEIPITFSQNSI